MAELELAGEVSLWPNEAVPVAPAAADAKAVELGVRFRTQSAGKVTAIRFYKGAGNGGTHVGHLWSATGQQLASVNFTQETASGWQEARLGTPVTLTPNTTYVVSYYAPQGHYADANDFFAQGAYTRGPLTALRDGADGPNGLYHYGSSAFPTDSWRSSNYYVDVLFQEATSAGQGLSAQYFSGMALGTPVLSRVDSQVAFDWGTGSPAASVPADNFSARWTGQVLAAKSGSYTFTTRSDDGVRLWVNGQQLVNNWTDHGATDNSGKITLTAGQRYDLRLEYYEKGGRAVMQLDWTPPGETRMRIPNSQLFPTSAPVSDAGTPPPTDAGTPPADAGSPPNPPTDGGTLGLPIVPWEGGPSYYSQFSVAHAAGVDNPSFFPIGVWFESVLDPADVTKDKAAGLNTYVVLTDNSNLGLLRSNNMFFVGGNSGSGSETASWFLDDEADMRFGPGSGPVNGNGCSSSTPCGYTWMQNLVNGSPRNGHWLQANYGKGVMYWESDTQAARFVNSYQDVVSTDLYWYTDPNACGEMQTFMGLPSSTCRLAANYGMTIDRQRYLDGLDGKRQPIWAFVEVGHPASESNAPSITPDQIKGAVMSSLIHGARGVIYFNHSFGGPCITQHALRESCYANQRTAVTTVNGQIKDLATVLNSPSYQYTFNAKVDTMLKQAGGSTYVFAMVGRAQPTGSYTLTLPAGLRANSVQVLYENRSIAVSNGAFTDTFTNEFSYHIYKIN